MAIVNKLNFFGLKLGIGSIIRSNINRDICWRENIDPK